MRGVTVVLLIGLVLSLPTRALSKGEVMTDDQLEAIGALPEDSDAGTASAITQLAIKVLPEDSRLSTAFVAAQRQLERESLVIFVVPATGGSGVAESILQFRGTPISAPR